MTGVLPVDKPEGFTSFDVVAKMRGLSKTRKIGHSGTLDPMATGVLPLFFDSATKACAVLPDGDKRYTAGIRLGLCTDTQDVTGSVLKEALCHITREEFEAAAAKFVGATEQLPPMYSAVKVAGQPLYKAARRGVEVERQSRRVTVYCLSTLAFDEDAQTAVIDVRCSKGTYIRTLGADIGEALGCGAALYSLRRTEAAGFTIDDCLTLAEIKKLASSGHLEEALFPVDRLFSALPRLVLNARDEELYRNGVPLAIERRGWEHIDGDIAVYGEDGALFGVSYMDEGAGQLHLRKMLVTK